MLTSRIIRLLALMTLPVAANAGVIRGVVTDESTQEALIGATISVSPGAKVAVTDIDGCYDIQVASGTYTITVSYGGYTSADIKDVRVSGTGETKLDIVMKPDSETLSEVTVVANARRSSETVVAKEQQESMVVLTGVGAAQIAKTQDKDASEVIRRVPGVSIIDDKFVMVRGLSQRYNNVWLNGGAVPSSEADSRAFSFDIIPSSQLENLTIVKSPAPEYPSDFTGGFILVNTKQEPVSGQLNISAGIGINDRTHFRTFVSSKGSATDFLGFDNGFRKLSAGMEGKLNTYPGYGNRIDILGNGFNNDWRLRNSHPWADMKLSADYSRLWRMDGGAQWGIVVAANYSNTYKTLTDMENSLYGPYDTTNDKPVFLRKATDNQWINDSRIGLMANLSFRPSGNRHFFEWKNIFNQIGRDRYSTRTGFNAQPDNINNQEYYYSSRTTYNTQLTGKHTFDKDYVDWSAGYAYSNNDMPDRRLIERTDRTDQRMGIYRISREFTRLDENIFSANANYRRTFDWSWSMPVLKAGVYAEHRNRQYRTREFQYGWQPDNSLPQGFLFDDDVATNVLVDENYGPDKLYMYEEVNMLNNYDGQQTTLAGYLGFNLPVNKFNFYLGCRYEYARQVLRMNTKQYEESWQDTPYDYSDFFPSINATYRIDTRHQLRLAYGRSVNRPEFRELSPSVFYDFDLGSNVMGNYDLKAAYIENVDFRYEWYPGPGEQVSLALFYKHFTNPIEWTYTVAGGTDLIYSFVNAKGANNYGIELDIRKNLGFIGLKDFSLSFNGALIKSKVSFEPGSNNIDRPMQGQSPYLINTGIFYNNAAHGWNASVLYNRIGKRIIGVGNRYGTNADGTSRNIPNSYEMPRNTLDLSVAKKFGGLELKLAVRDLLAEKCRFSQYETITNADGSTSEIEEVNRSYRPGRTFNLTISYKF